MKLYIGNLPLSYDEEQSKSLFTSYSSILSCKLILDRETGKSRGFGFVEFKSNEEAEKAIEELNGKDVDGRALVVNEARSQERRPGGGNGGGRNRPPFRRRF